MFSLAGLQTHRIEWLPMEPRVRPIGLGLWLLPCSSPSSADSVRDWGCSVLECSKPWRHLLEVCVAQPHVPAEAIQGPLLRIHRCTGPRGVFVM